MQVPLKLSRALSMLTLSPHYHRISTMLSLAPFPRASEALLGSIDITTISSTTNTRTQCPGASKALLGFIDSQEPGVASSRGIHLGSPYHLITYHLRTYHLHTYHILTYHLRTYHLRTYHLRTYHLITYHLITYHIRTYHLITYHLHTYHAPGYDTTAPRARTSELL